MATRHVKGDRVGALLAVENGKAYLFGYGVYEGDEIPPLEINPWLNSGNPNPKIKLDSGKIVWGCECWWGPEDQWA